MACCVPAVIIGSHGSGLWGQCDAGFDDFGDGFSNDFGEEDRPKRCRHGRAAVEMESSG